MAWRKLAVILSNHDAPYTKIADAAGHAYRHRDHLSELEKQSAIAYYADQVELDLPKAAEAYRAILAIDPDNTIGLNNLSLNQLQQHHFAESESLAVKCMRDGQFANCPINAIGAQSAQGAVQRADSTLRALGAQVTGRPEHEGRSRAGSHVASRLCGGRASCARSSRYGKYDLLEGHGSGDLGSIESAQGHLRSQRG